MRGNSHVRFGGRPRGKEPARGHLAAWSTLRAPCGALSHLSFSEEELGGKFLDPPAYPDTER